MERREQGRRGATIPDAKWPTGCRTRRPQFDPCFKPDPALTKAEEAQVKKVARTLLEILKREELVLDWRKRQQTRQAVRLCSDEMLDTLPTVYVPEVYRRKCELTYQHVYDSYYGEGRSIYGAAT